MKKYYFLPIVFFFCLVSGAQNISFPDPVFKEKLLTSNPFISPVAHDQNGNYLVIDADSDGEITQAEALAVYEMTLDAGNITNVSGIEYFTNLASLAIYDNPISSLSVSAMTNLTILSCYETSVPTITLNDQLVELHCTNNAITNLDVSHCPNLKVLNCGYNDLTILDVANVPMLEQLQCQDNQIVVLNVSNLPNLKSLNCANNAITELAVVGMNYLESLDCRNNLLTELDLAGVASQANIGWMFWLYCDHNNLTSLDVTALGDVAVRTDCSYNPNLTFLSVKNGTLFFDQINGEPPFPGPSVFFAGTPELQYLCTDEMNVVFVQDKIANYGYTGVQVNALCNDIITFTDEKLKARILASSPSNSIAKDLGGNFAKVDRNSDGEIQVLEAMLVSALNVSNSASTPEDQKITDVIGIQYFKNANAFNFMYNKISAADFSNMEELRNLNVGYNQLTDLNIEGTDLFSLYVPHNQLTALDPAQFPGIDFLDCSYNQLMELSFPQQVGSISLKCNNNLITSLVLPPKLMPLFDCSNNQLAYLDISGVENFGEFDWYGQVNLSANPMTYLKACMSQPHYCVMTMSNLPNLQQISCLPMNNGFFQSRISQYQLTGCTLDNTCSLGVLPSESQMFTIYPNPVESVLSIVSSEVNFESVQIYNLSGQLLVERKGHIQAVDVSNLDSGTYFVRIHSDKGMSTSKFIKE
jgi:Leucine-rich repeat (LRR) protein